MVHGMIRPKIDHCSLAVPPLIQRLPSMARFVSVVAVSSAGLNRQITFAADDQTENGQNESCGAGFKTQTGVSDMTINFFQTLWSLILPE
jgi:uncharacterized membrane protein